MNELNAAWNAVYRRIFNFHIWESVKIFINGLGKLDLKHIIQWRHLKFLWKSKSSFNSVINDITFMYNLKNDTHSLLFKNKNFLHCSLYDIKLFVRNDFNSICNT